MRLAEDLGADTVRYQGNWIPHALRAATEDGVFFVGDSAGHCLPLTAEGIRTALYFGLACGRELRAVTPAGRPASRRSPATTPSPPRTRWPFRWMLRIQRLVPRVPPAGARPGARAMATKRFVDWSFGHYLEHRAPDFVAADARPPPLAAHLRRGLTGTAGRRGPWPAQDWPIASLDGRGAAANDAPPSQVHDEEDSLA